MTAEQFIEIWKDNKLTERGGAQAHFDDLCDLLGVDKPRDPDNYCFERGAKKSAGGDGWADVWKRGCFGWENKKPGRDLDTALKQLTDYALQLDNPPLLVVSDRERIIIHTAFTGYPDQSREIRIEELTDPGVRQMLRWVFTEPVKLRPEKSTAAITAEAAGQFANLAKGMRQRGLDSQRVAHFLVQCLFCMFAEDETILPVNILTDLLNNAGSDTAKAGRRLATLFAAMEKNGGEYGDHDIAWFNGGLFKTIDVPVLTGADLAALYSAAADMDWRAIDPTIFGTLFERGLDPTARAPLGAHYTDTGTIAKLIQPLIATPLLAEWQAAKIFIAAGQGRGPRSKEYKDAQSAYHGFMQRLSRFRVLDPACGSGNFLYLALKALRDVEKLAQIEARELGITPELLTYTGPQNILGIEINEYAAELARVTVWIGDIQWCRRNGREIAKNPILRALDRIEHRDALLNPDGSEAAWPKADVIVGNPPFLGDKMMRGELGDSYVEKLRSRYDGRVPGGADLVTYWFEKARAQIAAGQASAAGLVTTNSIRQKRNRVVLERILESTRIFEAWSDEEWINEGAAVRVSLVCFGGDDSPLPSGEGPGVRAKMSKAYRDIPENILQAARKLRARQTDAEILLWQLVRNSALGGFKFRRQHPVTPYILDFYCHEAKLAIELDGGQHAEQRDYDNNRDKALETLGIKTVRFWNNQLFNETEAVLSVIWDELHMRTGSAPSPRPSPGGRGCVLDGLPVAAIHADLTGSVQGEQALDLTTARTLPANKGRSFFGICLAGPFKVDTITALQWLKESGNPNGRLNSDVVRPIYNGSDITRRWAGNWVVDFSAMEQAEAADYLLPFAHVEAEVKPIRVGNREAVRAAKWWRHGRSRPELRKALAGLAHYIATPETAKHRFFVKFPLAVAPEHSLIVIPRQDDVTLGILSSRIHCVWALAKGGRMGMGNDPRYNASLTFETFPFPEGFALTRPAATLSKGARDCNCNSNDSPLPPGEGPGVRADAIATAAADLNDWREKWLNPEGWLTWEITPEEQSAGFPARPVPKPEQAAAWKKRTLTNLYNEMPAGLKLRQEALDKAVAAAYGWSDYTQAMADDVILGRLLKLNLKR